MKAKYFIYLMVIFWSLGYVVQLFSYKLLTDFEIEPFDYGLIAGGINLLLFLSVIGLLIKIFSYKDRHEFLNS